MGFCAFAMTLKGTSQQTFHLWINQKKLDLLQNKYFKYFGKLRFAIPSSNSGTMHSAELSFGN